MRISLPREDSDSCKLKSPRKHSASNTFTEFAGRVSEGAKRHSIPKHPTSPPPLPPPRQSSSRPSNWINFEEIPEKRKAPKRIQTVPRADESEAKGYSYVQPEECRCECHEESRRASLRESCSSNGERGCNGDKCQMASSSGERANLVR